jgi:hypothetical protein
VTHCCLLSIASLHTSNAVALYLLKDFDEPIPDKLQKDTKEREKKNTDNVKISLLSNRLGGSNKSRFLNLTVTILRRINHHKCSFGNMARAFCALKVMLFATFSYQPRRRKKSIPMMAHKISTAATVFSASI